MLLLNSISKVRLVILGRLAKIRLMAQARFGEFYFRLIEPEIYQSYLRLLDAGVKKKMTKQSSRMLDLRMLLLRYRPQHIAELGSGLSTLIFANFCQKQNASLDSFEENPDWVRLLELALPPNQKDKYKPTLVNRVLTADECHYDQAIPKGVDFVYVDGPANRKEGGIDRPCTDLIHALRRGERPRVICIDGRKSTVTLVHKVLGELAKSDDTARYDWKFSVKYSDYLGQRVKANRTGNHCIAVRAI